MMEETANGVNASKTGRGNRGERGEKEDKLEGNTGGSEETQDRRGPPSHRDMSNAATSPRSLQHRLRSAVAPAAKHSRLLRVLDTPLTTRYAINETDAPCCYLRFSCRYFHLRARWASFGHVTYVGLENNNNICRFLNRVVPI